MVQTESELYSEGRKALKGRWLEAAMLTFVYMLITVLFSLLIGSALDLLCTGLGTVASMLLLPLQWGYYIAFLANLRSETDPFNVSYLFYGYRDFSRIFTTMLLQQIYVLLWALLLIVPGIVKGLSYALTPYVLRDYQELKNNEAIELSMAMMDGHKLKLFYLVLINILLVLASLLTLGIALFWVMPWWQSTLANFYEQVKTEYEDKV